MVVGLHTETNLCVISGVARRVEAGGAASPQFPRQDISTRLNCTKCANLVCWFSEKYLKLLPPELIF